MGRKSVLVWWPQGGQLQGFPPICQSSLWLLSGSCGTSPTSPLCVCMQITSLPGACALGAGSCHHPRLCGRCPTGLLHPGPFDLGLPNGRS